MYTPLQVVLLHLDIKEIHLFLAHLPLTTKQQLHFIIWP